jgi:uncharacterized phage infection (PIP) family protein YhgE
MDIFKLDLNPVMIHNLKVIIVAASLFLVPLLLMFYSLGDDSKEDNLAHQEN